MIWAVAVCVLAFVTVWTDARALRIPNRVVLGLLGLFVIAALLFYPPQRSLWAGIIACLVFLFAFLLFYFDRLPGGDVKFATVAVLFIHPGDWFVVLFAFYAVVLTVLWLIVLMRWQKKKDGEDAPQASAKAYPLGVPMGLILGVYVAQETLWPALRDLIA